MKFKKIRIKNIRSYKNQEISFPKGSLLLAGDIGAGKSSILFALEYALFGLQPGQKGTILLRNNEDAGEVILDLEISGQNIRIHRKLKRTPKGVSNEYASIEVNGKKTEASITEIKSKIVKLLGYPQEFVRKNNILYRFTVHSPQEQMKQIILEDSETRVNILRHVFGVEKYKQIKTNLLILLSSLKINARLMQGEIRTLEKDKEEVEERKKSLRNIEEKIIYCQGVLKEKIKQREVLEEGIKEISDKIKEKRKLENEVEKSTILVTIKRNEHIKTEKEIIDIEENIKEAHPINEKDILKFSNNIISEEENLKNINSEYIRIISKLNSLEEEQNNIVIKKERIFKIDICPTCLQDVHEAHKHNILNETETRLTEIKKELGNLQNLSKDIELRIKNKKDTINELKQRKTEIEIQKLKQEQVGKFKKKLEILKKNKESMEKDIKLLGNHTRSLKEKILDYTVFENHYHKKEIALEEAQVQERKAEIGLAEINKELEFAYREIKLFKDIISKKEDSKKKLYSLNELIDWLGTHFQNLVETIETNVLLKLRKEFSSLFKKWFQLLIPEGSLDSQIDENFTPIILQKQIEMLYEFLSGGERTAVALAYRLALNQIINSTHSKIKTKGVIILDEPTDGFSEGQITKIRDILEELSTEQIIIVSHEQKIEGFVDNVLRIIKLENTSHIELPAETSQIPISIEYQETNNQNLDQKT